MIPFTNNAPASASRFMDLSSTQTIAGTKTFSGEIIVPTPTNSTDAVTKAYVDSAIALTPQKLATITGINTKSTGQTNLYTVPTGKTCVITQAIVRCTAASAITNGPTASIGFTSTAYTDIYIAENMMVLTGTTAIFGYVTVGMSAIAVATTIIKFNISSASSGTSQTVAVDLIGYLF